MRMNSCRRMSSTNRSLVGILLSTGMLLGAVAGCGDGERIPVVPVLSTLDRPPDPFLVCLAPRSGDRAPADAVWLNDEEAYIVGAAGQILGLTPAGTWSPEASGTDHDLLAIAGRDGGPVVAVGRGGTILERSGGSWTRRESGTQNTLCEVLVSGDDAWAVGAAATIVRSRAGGPWESFACPAGGDLTGVCVQSDTLYVSGRDGLLLRWTDGAWSDLGNGPWGDTDLLAVAALPGGPTTVLADSLYELCGGTWSGRRIAYASDGFRGMKAACGYFWIEYEGRVYRTQPAPQEWSVTSYYLGDGPVFAAPRDTARALLVSGEGSIRWYDSDHGSRDDPAGSPGNGYLFRLADGTKGCLTPAGLLVPGPTGLVQPVPFSDAAMNALRGAVAAGGASLDDFYVARSSYLYRVRNGEVEWREQYPDYASANSLAVDDQGIVYIGTSSGIRSWDGQEFAWDLVGLDSRDVENVARGPRGTILAWGAEGSWYRAEHEWVCMSTRSVLFCGEIPSGEILTLTRTSTYAATVDSMHIWRRETSSRVSRRIDLVPGSERLPVETGAADETGFYVSTYTPSRIFRLIDDPRAGRWDAVAGPFGGRVVRFMPMEDGSLLAYDALMGHLMLRRFR